jgi:transposase-like protein
MPISRTNPFKGRHYPSDVILSAVRWYLRCSLAHLHVSELLADAGYIWRWVQAFTPELNKRCRPRLTTTNKSYRIHEIYSALSSVLLRRVKVPLVLG